MSGLSRRLAAPLSTHAARAAPQKAIQAAVLRDGDVPFTTYTPEENSAYWQTRPVAVVKRTLQVAAAFAGWAATARPWGARAGTAELSAQRAEMLRRLLTDLGPAFVKIGQAVSARCVAARPAPPQP